MKDRIETFAPTIVQDARGMMEQKRGQNINEDSLICNGCGNNFLDVIMCLKCGKAFCIDCWSTHICP